MASPHDQTLLCLLGGMGFPFIPWQVSKLCRSGPMLATRAGGEALEAMSTAATEAAKEAATGAWLAEFESGALPRVAAPGLPHGLFGAWQQPDGLANGADGLPMQATSPGGMCHHFSLPLHMHAGEAVHICHQAR